MVFFSCIHGVPGGMVNILRGYSIGHSKQKTLHEHVSYSERFPRQSHLNANHKTVDKKEILRVRTFSNTGIYCSSDRVGTVYNKCSKIPPSTSMHFVTRERTWRICVCVCVYISICIYIYIYIYMQCYKIIKPVWVFVINL